jgi:leader peptidase (prepilin peptidase)/N-methyltransferase
VLVPNGWLAGAATALGVLLSGWLAGIAAAASDAADRRWFRARPRGGRSALAAGAVAGPFCLLAALAAGWSSALPAWICLALVLTPLVLIDLRLHRLPNRLVISGYGLAAGLLGAAALAGEAGAFGRAALAGAATFTVFAVAGLTGGIGFGDVKLAGLLGAYLGWIGWTQLVVGIFTGFAIGAAGAVLLLVSRRAGWRTEVAFGPSLMLGALLVAAFG